MIQGLYKIFDHWHERGTLFICSDPHFNDAELDAVIPGRPTAAEQIKLLNSRIGRTDTLIILGDIGDVECVRQVRGRKILIAGNHDAGMSNYTDVFDEVYSGPLIIGEKLILSHEPVDIPWAFNIHGHTHRNCIMDNKHFNACLDANDYLPINLNQWMKQGYLSTIETIHRSTINTATKRSKKRKKNLTNK
jgi:calcineurin-like phosphoesterase family protein